MLLLEKVGQVLAGMHSLTVAECERAFNCQLQPDPANPRQYWGSCPALNIEVLDVRLGQRGGIVVARFAESVQVRLAEAVGSLGAPEAMDLVSPPPHPASAPAWSRKWRVAHTLGGAKIWFGLEEVAGDKRLVSASRTFTPGAIIK